MTRLAVTEFSVSLDVDDVVDRRSPINHFHEKQNHESISLCTNGQPLRVRKSAARRKPTHGVAGCECDIKGFEQISGRGVKQRISELSVVVSRTASVANLRSIGKLPREVFALFSLTWRAMGSSFVLVHDVVLSSSSSSHPLSERK